MDQPWADRPQSWPIAATEDIWRGAAPFAVRRDRISHPDHPEDTFDRLVVEHPGAVVILAVDDDGRALCLQQYRHPPAVRFVELPAGLLDVVGEEPELAARRELLEEGTCTATTWHHLNTLYTSPGILAERIEVFLATGLNVEADRGDFELVHEEADMTVHWVPVAELVTGVLERRITDGPLVAAVMTYAVLQSRGELPIGHEKNRSGRGYRSEASDGVVREEPGHAEHRGSRTGVEGGAARGPAGGPPAGTPDGTAGGAPDGTSGGTPDGAPGGTAGGTVRGGVEVAVGGDSRSPSSVTGLGEGAG